MLKRMANAKIKNLYRKINISNISIFSNKRLSIRLIRVISFITLMAFLLLLGTIYDVLMTSAKMQYINSANQVLEQNKNYIEYITKSINNYAIQIISDKDLIEILQKDFKDDYDKLLASKALESKVSSIALSNDIISDVFIIIDGKINYGYPNIKSDITTEKVPYYKEFVESKSPNYWTPPAKLNLGFVDDITVSNYSAIKDLDSGKKLGLLVISLSPLKFSKALMKNNDGSIMYIVNQEGNIISHPDLNFIGKELSKDKKANLNNEKGYFYFKDNLKEKLIIYTTAQNGWKLVYEVPKNLLLKDTIKILNYILIVGILFILIITLTIIVYMRRLLKPLDKIVRATQSIETGDLTINVDVNTKDELGKLSNIFNNMINNLRTMIEKTSNAVNETKKVAGDVSSSVYELHSAIYEISASIQSILDGANTQNDMADICTDKVKSFGNQLRESVETFENLDKKSKIAMQKSLNGIEYVKSIINEFDENVKSINNVKEMSNSLTLSTKNVEAILNDINQIAEQTNLLALNAAIEAARAGEAGRGFMVVADEVRKLADSSKKSASTIVKIIKDINRNISNTSMSMENIANVLNNQTKSINEIISIFNEINESFKEVALGINKFGDAVNQIDKSKEEVISSIYEIANISQSTATSISEISTASEEQVNAVENVKNLMTQLEDVSSKLEEIILQFKI
ncbi:MAG: methyl-accepting chemotaxis protein [Caloramator sp.]|nr:methyl-accepting chemotaxis protein [Caloramator sp.]